jgi:hypothetical protein
MVQPEKVNIIGDFLLLSIFIGFHGRLYYSRGKARNHTRDAPTSPLALGTGKGDTAAAVISDVDVSPGVQGYAWIIGGKGAGPIFSHLHRSPGMS